MARWEVKTNRKNNVVYGRSKNAVPEENLTHPQNTFSKKLMVSAILSWRGVSKPIFVADEKIKVNSQNFLKHLEDNLIPAIEQLYLHKDFIYVQDSASSHRSNLVQTFLKEKLKKRYVANTEWPPNSPDCNPLDYYLWNEVSSKVYEGSHRKPFTSLDELKARIEEVWKNCTSDLSSTRKAIKQFRPRLQAVADKNGGSIKTLYG